MISNERKIGDNIFITISEEGISHRRGNIPNQDAVMYNTFGKDYVIAVSDGVGSCVKADIGSKAAVESVRKVFNLLESGELEIENKSIITNIIKFWNDLITDDVNDCCATLKAAIKINNKMILFSIGDGLLIVISNGITKAAPIEESCFINQTSCLNKNVDYSDFWISTFLIDEKTPHVVFMCTDGVSNGITEGQELNLVRELETNIDYSLLKKELEELIITISQFNADDKSLGVVKYVC